MPFLLHDDHLIAATIDEHAASTFIQMRKPLRRRDLPLSLIQKFAHPAELIIFEGLLNLLQTIHHEWTATDNRLIDRLATHQQHSGICTRANRDRTSISAENAEIAIDGIAIIQTHVSFQHEHRRSVSVRYREFSVLPSANINVQKADRRESSRRTFPSAILARDHAHASSV